MSLKVITFSDVCGENVELSDENTVATWKPMNSGGWACSDQEVKPGETVEVRVEGSGRCDIGFMKRERSSRSFKTLNEIRAHRKTCSIPVTFNDTGEEISSTFGEKTFKKKIEKGTQVWIAIFIRYGNMSVEFLSNEPSQNHQKFSSNDHGPNIILESDNTKASSVSKSPASVCFLSERLQIGGTVYLKCASEKEGGREISRYELKLQVSENCPKDLQKDFRYLFEASEEKTRDSPLTTVEIIEKDECNGNIAVTLSNDRAIQYTTARGKQNTQTLSFNVKNGVWIVLDLYGVSVRVMSEVPDESMNNSRGEDQPDSIPIARMSKVTAVPPESLLYDRKQSNGENGEMTGSARINSMGQQLDNMTVQPSAQQHPIPHTTHIPVAGASRNETGEKFNTQKHFPYLVQEIETLVFCDHLFAKSIISQGQMDEIHAQHRHHGGPAANRELLKMINKKKILKKDMEEIVNAAGQSHLLDMFYPKQETQERKF